MTPWIDVQLVTMGYLRSPAGAWRHVPHLDTIAEDTLHAGIRVRWGIPPWRRRACSYVWHGEIVLHRDLWPASGEAIRAAWAHELAHCLTGSRSDERARVWVQWSYGEFTPAWAG